MTSISIDNASKNISGIVDQVNENSTPVTIITPTGRNAVILSEADWNALSETIYLHSVPGFAKSIIDGGNASHEDCISDEGEIW